MINPVLYLGFKEKTDAERAAEQHICLCRNEDILLPIINDESDNLITEISEEEFDKHDGDYTGFELLFGNSDSSFLVGSNRFDDNAYMFGKLLIVGNNPLISNNF